jgi:hypothetical protein
MHGAKVKNTSTMLDDELADTVTIVDITVECLQIPEAV